MCDHSLDWPGRWSITLEYVSQDESEHLEVSLYNASVSDDEAMKLYRSVEKDEKGYLDDPADRRSLLSGVRDTFSVAELDAIREFLFHRAPRVPMCIKVLPARVPIIHGVIPWEEVALDPSCGYKSHRYEEDAGYGLPFSLVGVFKHEENSPVAPPGSLSPTVEP